MGFRPLSTQTIVWFSVSVILEKDGRPTSDSPLRKSDVSLWKNDKEHLVDAQKFNTYIAGWSHSFWYMKFLLLLMKKVMFHFVLGTTWTNNWLSHNFEEICGVFFLGLKYLGFHSETCTWWGLTWAGSKPRETLSTLILVHNFWQSFDLWCNFDLKMRNAMRYSLWL